MFKSGDVIGFNSVVAGKHKFHLCLGFGGCFLFINTPRKPFRGDFVVDCTEISCLEPTESGKSVISCSTVIKMTNEELDHCKAKKVGEVSHSLLVELLKFVEASPVIPASDKDAILDGLGDSI